MRFKVDENLPVECAELLREADHDAITVIEEGIGGKDDHYIVETCIHEKRVLITLDTDFSDIRTYPPQKYTGFIVLRIQKQDKKRIIALIQRTIPFLEENNVKHKLLIVEERKIRIRS